MADAVLDLLEKESGRRADDREGAARFRANPAVQQFQASQPQRYAEGARIDARDDLAGKADGSGVPRSQVVGGSSDPVLDFLTKEAGGRVEAPKAPPQKPAWPTGLVDQIPGMAPQPQPKAQAPFVDRVKNALVGAGEGALTIGSGLLAAPVAAAGGALRTITSGKYGGPESARVAEERARELLESLTYKPRTEGGKEALGVAGKVLDATKLQGLGPSEMVALSDVASGLKAAGQINSATKSAGLGQVAGAGPSGETALSQVTPKAIGPSGERVAGTQAPAAQFGSVGAQGASRAEQARAMAANASPEIQNAVRAAGERVDIDALRRHVDADTLPEPVKLLPGQATQDVVALSKEHNKRGKFPAVAQHYDEQNKALATNIQRIRENAAPDIYVNAHQDAAGEIAGSYRLKDLALNKDISAKYQALRDANGGNFPLDSNAFVSAADKALHKELLYDFVPADLRKTLDRVKTDGMTFENFESLRTRLAAVQRSNADGNVKAAAGVVRDQLEALPMPAGAEHLKPLADAARSAAKSRFDLLKADPAYKAVIDGKANTETFIANHVFKRDVKQVATMMNNLDDSGKQAVRAGVIAQLKKSAGIGLDGEGNFSQANYNKALDAIRPKLSVIFEPEQAAQLEQLGRVARYTQAQPRGSFVNNSNTTVSALGELADNAKAVAKASAEGVLTAKGVPVPFLKDYLQSRSTKKEIAATLKPGGGILLRDVGK